MVEEGKNDLHNCADYSWRAGQTLDLVNGVTVNLVLIVLYLSDVCVRVCCVCVDGHA